MTWLTWRQFRTQALAALGALLAVGVYLAITGSQIRHSYSTDLGSCQGHGGCGAMLTTFENQYDTQLNILSYLVIAVPGVIGLFWGAPLITRELEAGTHRLAWNQTVTRRQWLGTKLALIGLASVVVTGLLSLLVTWWASPIDKVEAKRFSPVLFDARNIVPLGYALFAFVLGTTIGLLLRRTVLAMAVTLVAFAGVQIAMPLAVRPHLVPATTSSVEINAATLNGNNSFIFGANNTMHLGSVTIPDAWVVSTSAILNSSGDAVPADQITGCIGAPPATHAGACLAKQNLHVQAKYLPADRYWTLQWYETVMFVVLAALLAGFGFWWIRGRLT